MARRYQPTRHRLRQLPSRVVMEPPLDAAEGEVEAEAEVVVIVRHQVPRFVRTARQMITKQRIVGLVHPRRKDQNTVHLSLRLSVER